MKYILLQLCDNKKEGDMWAFCARFALSFDKTGGGSA